MREFLLLHSHKSSPKGIERNSTGVDIKKRTPRDEYWGLFVCLKLVNLKNFECSGLVSSRIFLRNSLKRDLLILYGRLVELGVDYRNGKVYLAELDETKNREVQ